jgi:hypothetical protein
MRSRVSPVPFLYHVSVLWLTDTVRSYGRGIEKYIDSGEQTLTERVTALTITYEMDLVHDNRHVTEVDTNNGTGELG